MLYAIVRNNAVAEVVTTIPKTFRTKDGTIANFDHLTASEQASHGFYGVTDVTPAHDGRYVTESNPVYTIAGTGVELLYTLTQKDLLVYKQDVIAQVYKKAKQLLDAQAEGYSLPEIATWPTMQAEILAYNANNTVIGATMQSVISEGLHTAASLAALLTPRISLQQNILVNRATLTNAIDTAVDHAAVAAVDITVGW